MEVSLLLAHFLFSVCFCLGKFSLFFFFFLLGNLKYILTMFRSNSKLCMLNLLIYLQTDRKQKTVDIF